MEKKFFFLESFFFAQFISAQTKLENTCKTELGL